MAYCGVPTLTCVIMLLLLAALYAEVSSSIDDNGVLESEHINKRSVGDAGTLNAISRGLPGRNTNRGQTRTRRPPTSNNITRGPRTRPGSGSQVNARRPRPESGRRPRPESNNDGLPAGVNRQMLRRAAKIHNASTPFAARLFQIVANRPLSNIVISPLSVHTALTMTMLGAKGKTEKEMFATLGFKAAGLRNKMSHQAYKALLASLQNVNIKIKLSTANAVYVKPSIPLENSFRQGLVQWYNASFDSFQLDHPRGPENPINSWVSNVTSNKIQNLLPAGSITPLTALVLINAIYFKAPWAKPFTGVTRPGEFRSLADGVQMIDTMTTVNTYRYADHHNTEVIELLYEGDRLAMYILLPNASSNITSLQQKLTNSGRPGHNTIDPFFENLRPEYLRLFLPKFKIDNNAVNLNEPLKEMGIVEAFNDKKANFTGISSRGDLYINSVLHKAFIDVNENGTEAAAATAVIIGIRSALPRQTREVKVDRPFMFVIRDNVLKEILFLGAFVSSGQQ
uniref:Serpin domain-containing protein n=1 Tax=Arion vulgaris TaxID=1028688 RepID=A0A0B7AP59_9EUPU